MTTTERTSRATAGAPRRSSEGLSVTMLVVAALASATAAIVTSTFWRGGTIVTAAITPVIVAIMKELLSRPLESDLMRRPVERVRSAAPETVRTRRFEREPRVSAHAGGRRAPEPPRPAFEPEPAPLEPTAGDRALGTAPIRTYRRRRRLRLGLALTTAVAAFAIALVVLTVPELIFGGSLASKGRTTFFGGRTATTVTTPKHGSSGQSTTSPSQQNGSTTTSPHKQTSTSQSQSPSQQSPSQSPSQQSPPSSQQPPPSSSSPPSGGTPSGK